MRSSPRFLSPGTDWIIFIVLLSTSLLLLLLGKNPAVKTVKDELSDGFSYLTSPMKYVRQSLSLWRENTSLREISMQLSKENNELRDFALENIRLRSMLEFKERTNFPLKAAEVIAYVGPAVGGQIRINAGSADGILINTVIMTPQGLVGKVTDAADHSSLVQTLEGNSYGVSVMVERSRQIGILKWDKPGEWRITSMPTGADVKVGDLIVTTGAGSVFPGGVRVGVLDEISSGGGTLGKDYSVKPFVNFQGIEEVFYLAAPPNYSEPSDIPSQAAKKKK